VKYLTTNVIDVMTQLAGFAFAIWALFVLLLTCALALQQRDELFSRRSFMVGAAGSMSSLWIGGKIKHVLTDPYNAFLPAGTWANGVEKFT
jgi:hypothetical protein